MGKAPSGRTTGARALAPCRDSGLVFFFFFLYSGQRLYTYKYLQRQTLNCQTRSPVSSGIFEWSGVSQPPAPTLIGWTSNTPRPHASPSGNALPHGPHQNPSGGGRGSLGRMLAPSRTSSRRRRAWLVRLGAMSEGGSPIAACHTTSGNAPFFFFFFFFFFSGQRLYTYKYPQRQTSKCAFRVLHRCVFTGVFKG
jgi:hypothetical protein